MMAKVVASDESIKECPICGSPIQKTYGCDYMMCGHSAHGSLGQAIRNGGCGVVFYFSNLGIIQRDHWTDLDGVRVGGVAVTARQIRKNGPGTEIVHPRE